MKPILFDYHTQALDHGENKPIRIEETVESAIEKGLVAICLTDHYRMPPNFSDATDDARVQYPQYMEDVMKAKNKYKNEIEVIFGAEFEWLAGFEDWTEEETKKYPFDYTIGSVHYVRGIPIDFIPEYFEKAINLCGGIQGLVKEYFLQTRRCAQSMLFSSIGHLDRIKEFNRNFYSEDETWYRKEVLETLDCISKTTKTMEINTSGLRKVCKAIYPSEWIVRQACKRNIDLTIGSDAHTPENIGSGLEKGIEIAKRAGYKKLVRFIKRKKIEVKI